MMDAIVKELRLLVCDDETEDLAWRAADRIEAYDHLVELTSDLNFELMRRFEEQFDRAEAFEKALRAILDMQPDPEFGTVPIETAQQVARDALEGRAR
jgi:hypothetical protein